MKARPGLLFLFCVFGVAGCVVPRVPFLSSEPASALDESVSRELAVSAAERIAVLYPGAAVYLEGETTPSPSGSLGPQVSPVPAVTAALETLQAGDLGVYLSSPANDEWELRPGSLSEQLAIWCDRAGWKLISKAESDVRLHANAVMRGAFETAVEDVFMGLSVQGNALRCTLYRGNNVLEVREN